MNSLRQTITLNEAEKLQLKTAGFLKFSGLISSDLLEELREALDRLCSCAAEFTDSAIIDGESGEKFVIGIDKLIAKPELIFKTLLGSPLLLSLAEAICGTDFFPVQDFAVIKNLGDQTPVNWHQDVLSNPHARNYMIGFYLDPATDENGALRIVPNSHLSDLSICDLEKMPYESIEMQAGDVLVHDLKLAHSSGFLRTFPKRRVVYFEFMEREEIERQEIYPGGFIEMRTSLIPAAIQLFSETHPEVSSFAWRNSKASTFEIGSNASQHIQDVCSSPLKVKAASYCFRAFEGTT